MKNKEYLTEENSCLVILTYYLNERLCRHCKFPNERPFPGLRKGWRGVGGGVGRSLSFSAVEKGAHSKGDHLGRDNLSDNYGMSIGF